MAPLHDAAYKALFSWPRVVRDLLVGFVPEDWVHALDFDTLEKSCCTTGSGDGGRARRCRS